MRLPIPFESAGRNFEDVDVAPPNTGALADVSRIAEDGHDFSAMAKMVESCTRINGEKIEHSDVLNMPYRDAEYIALMGVVGISQDDGFDGYYVCPRCGRPQTAEKTIDGDFRDFVSDMKIGFLKEIRTFSLSLSAPIELKSEGEVIERISHIEMRYPTLGDCINAERRSKDDLQGEIYTQSIVKINEKKIDPAWRNLYGSLLFKRLSIRDSKSISDEMRKYGLSQQLQKKCPKCKNIWMADVDTSSFFASALRSD
jgi:hypothetical protein